MLLLKWPLSRILLVFLSLAFLMLFAQVTLFHSRQNFRHPAMWTPVVEAPVASLLLLALALFPSSFLKTITTVFLAIGTLSGLGGFALHTQGVGQRVGGYTSENFQVGPPLSLPLMMAAFGGLGLLAIYWR